MPATLSWPGESSNRGAGYWLRPHNLIASRRKLRADHSNEWRYEFLRSPSLTPPPGCDPDPGARSRSFTWLIGPEAGNGFRCVILGDTGEGDHSQYALLPLIRALRPHFLVINGDVAYPAGTDEDFQAGFFQPYSNLGIPIWAVPGNHDYYSASRGREFHEIFCTELRRRQWEEAGLKLKPQPGTYWELSEPGPKPRLVILGVDSGTTGDLEGKRGAGFLKLGRRQPRDSRQCDWLEARLRRAQRAEASVVVLYHIPALVRESHQGDVHLDSVHRLVAQFSCVRLVITAHEHNYQRYDSPAFGRYLERQYAAPPASAPTYLVSGGGGGCVSASDFEAARKTGYGTASRYPTAEDWKQWAPPGLRIVAKVHLDKSFLNKVVIGLVSLKPGIAEESDADRPERLSLLLLERDAAGQTSVQPFFVDDLARLYPDGTQVRVQDGLPPLTEQALAGCRRDPAILL